jgi:nucleotide-binding universal stress UspA family protein
MNTVIVPVDFSETSLNAARYAVKFLGGQYGVNMILHHVYEKPNQSVEAGLKLEKLKEELMATGTVKITLLAEEGSDFITELEKLARHQQADLIVMGITGRSSLGQSFMGSNTLKMVEQKVCPILIIPAEARYQELKNVLLTSDFKNVYSTTPSVPIKKVLKPFKPCLHIMNVNSEIYISISAEYQAQKDKLNEMFSEFNPEFYFLGLSDIDDAINQFAQDKSIDLIIMIQKDQNIFSKLFKKSHTKKLVYQSTIPTLALHE